MSRTGMLTAMVCAVLLVGLAAPGWAQEGRPPYGSAVGIEDAKKIAAGAIAEAQRNDWRVAVAIVDNHGFLVYYERLDDTQTASAQIAVDKAKTAAMFRRPSRVFEEAVSKGRVSVMALTGATAVIGGLPIMKDGMVIGGVGVSGVASSQDEQAAQAGLDSWK